MRPWLARKSRSGYTTQRQSNRTSKAGAEAPLGLVFRISQPFSSWRVASLGALIPRFRTVELGQVHCANSCSGALESIDLTWLPTMGPFTPESFRCTLLGGFPLHRNDSDITALGS